MTEMLDWPSNYGMPAVPKQLPAWESATGGGRQRGPTAGVFPDTDPNWDGVYSIAGVFNEKPKYFRVGGSGVDWGCHNCDLHLAELGHDLEGGVFPAPDDGKTEEGPPARPGAWRMNSRQRRRFRAMPREHQSLVPEEVLDVRVE